MGEAKFSVLPAPVAEVAVAVAAVVETAVQMTNLE
jgi:hypothetical protein